MGENRGPGEVDYTIWLDMPKDVSLKLSKMLEEVKGFLNGALTLTRALVKMDKEGYDVPELRVLEAMIDSSIQLTNIVLARLSS